MGQDDFIQDSHNSGERLDSAPVTEKVEFLSPGVSKWKSTRGFRKEAGHASPPSVLVSGRPWKLDSCPHTEAGRGALSFLMRTIHRNGQALVKTYLGYKPGERLRRSQSVRERDCNFNFFKINALRKGRSGTYCQKEI